MESIYPQQVIHDVNARIDIRRMMQTIDYKFDKYQDSPKTVKCFCPIHCEGLFRNLIIDKEQRTFRCLYTQCSGSDGGNLIELFAQARKLPLDEAIRALVHDQALPVALPVDEKFVDTSLKTAEQHMVAGELEQADAIYTKLITVQPVLLQAHEGLYKIHTQSGNDEKRFDALAAITRLYISHGRTAEAADYIKIWAEARPDNPSARLAVAEMIFAEGDPESAIMEFMAAADACESAGDLDGAIAAYLRVESLSRELKLEVIDATPHITRVLVQANRQVDAIAHLQKQTDVYLAAEDYARAADLTASMLELDSQNSALHSRFLDALRKAPPMPHLAQRILDTANYFAGHDNQELAIPALEIYVSVAPQNEAALTKLLNAYYELGMPAEASDVEARLARLNFFAGLRQEAIARVRKVLEWQPDHVLSLEALADFDEAGGDIAGAREARRRMAKALTGKREFERAAEVLDALIADDSDATDLLEQQASNLEAFGKSGNADAQYRAAILFEQLAYLFRDTITGSRALQYMQRAAAAGASDPPLLLELASAQFRNSQFAEGRDTVVRACEFLIQNGKLSEALEECDKFVVAVPNEADLARYLAELYLRANEKEKAVATLRRLADSLAAAGRSREAEEAYEQALAFEPENLKTLTSRAEMYRAGGDNEKHASTLLRVAAVYESQGDLDTAVKTLEHLLLVNAEDASTVTKLLQYSERLDRPVQVRKWRLHLASLYRTENNFEREARALRDALARAPEDEEIMALLARCEFARKDRPAGVQISRRLASLQQRSGHADDARVTLETAIQSAPDHLELNRDLFEAYKSAGLASMAITSGRRFVELLSQSGRTAEATAAFDQVVQCDPQNIELQLDQVEFLTNAGRQADAAEKRLALARTYRERERFAEAEAALQEVLAVDSRHVGARQDLAELYNHLGESQKAEEQLAALADSYRVEGDAGKAAVTLGNILQTNPDSLDARRQLVQLYRSQGNTQESVKELHNLADMYRRQNSESEALAVEREAVELAPDDMNSRRRLVDCLLRLGKSTQAAAELELIANWHIRQAATDSAMAALEEALSLEPRNINSRRMRAELLSQSGDTAGALEEFRAIAAVAAENPHVSVRAGSQAESTDAASYSLQLVKEYDFDHFVVGANNNFAYATALAIARAPARAYNPFFMYADVGLGKTHLCNAIANHILTHDPKAKIIYTNSEDFTGELVDAIQNNAIQQFRTRYRSLDLMVVDDVQFLAGKERAQEEFFHIFNALFQAKRQIVVTSDRPPSEIAHLESRLRSRFGAGVIVDIATPDLETRIAILNREIESAGLELDAVVSRIVAERIDTNVRDLKGALNQVIAMRDLRGLEVTEENIRKMLDTLYARVQA